MVSRPTANLVSREVADQDSQSGIACVRLTLRIPCQRPSTLSAWVDLPLIIDSLVLSPMIFCIPSKGDCVSCYGFTLPTVRSSICGYVGESASDVK